MTTGFIETSATYGSSKQSSRRLDYIVLISRAALPLPRTSLVLIIENTRERETTKPKASVYVHFSASLDRPHENLELFSSIRSSSRMLRLSLHVRILFCRFLDSPPEELYMPTQKLTFRDSEHGTYTKYIYFEVYTSMPEEPSHVLGMKRTFVLYTMISHGLLSTRNA